MKKYFLLLMFSFPLIVCAQKIKTDEIDKFTKERIVETSFEKIVSDKNIMGSIGGRLMKDIWIAFRQVGNNTYLRLKWCSNNVIALRENADVLFLDKNGNTYIFKNTKFTIAGQGEGTVGFAGSALYGLNMYLTGNCSELKDKIITDMRINTTEGYIDFSLSKKGSEIIAKTYEIFESALNK